MQINRNTCLSLSAVFSQPESKKIIYLLLLFQRYEISRTDKQTNTDPMVNIDSSLFFHLICQLYNTWSSQCEAEVMLQKGLDKELLIFSNSVP